MKSSPWRSEQLAGEKARPALPTPARTFHTFQNSVPHERKGVPGVADAFAGWCSDGTGLPARRIGGEQDGAGLDETGTPLWLWPVPTVFGHAPVGDGVGDDRAPKPPHAPLFAFLLERAGFSMPPIP